MPTKQKRAALAPTVRRGGTTTGAGRSRTTGPARNEPEAARTALATVYSNESGRSYRLERLIGRGGFGEIYLATSTPAGIFPSQACVKIGHFIAGWPREA